MHETTFLRVLEETIRKDLRRDLEVELIEELRLELLSEGVLGFKSASTGSSVVDQNAFRADRLDTWIIAHAGKSFFPSTSQPTSHIRARQAYGRPVTAPQVSRVSPGAQQVNQASIACEPAPILRRELSSEETIALELINRHSTLNIGSSFSDAELKSAWRKAALRTHPDRFAGADLATQKRAADLFRDLKRAHDLLALVPVLSH